MRKLNFYYFLLFVILVILDQAAKYFAYTKDMGGFLNVLRPVFGFQLFPNENLAFSIRLPVLVMWILYSVLLALLLFWFVRNEHKTKSVILAFVLILAGALSNIFDRLSLGYVRDFIFVFWGNVFNLADVFILGGIITLLFFDRSKKA
jgi:signal peptidase II